mgnify:CR=1 FL=1
MGIIQKTVDYIQTKLNRAGGLMVYPYMTDSGIRQDWRVKDYMELIGKSDLANPVVHSTVKELAMAVAHCPLEFYRKKAKKIEKLPRKHSLVDLFWNVNPTTTRFDFWEATVTYLQSAGECPWALERMNKFDRPKELWVLRPDYIRVVPDDTGMVKGYIYDTGIGSVGYLAKEVIFLKYFDPTNQWRGLSPFSGCRQELIAEQYRTRYNINFFKQGASPSGVFTTEGKTLNADSYKRLQKELEMAYSGVDRAHRPMLLEQVKWQPMGVNPKDGDFAELHALNTAAIAGVVNVPAQFAFGSGNPRYGNVQMAKEHTKMFWGITIKPLIKKIEEYLNVFLVKRWGNDIYAKFDLSEIDAINDTNIEKSLIASRLVGMGIWTPNEARKELFNMEGTDGGDTRYVPTNIMEADSYPEEGDNNDEPVGDEPDNGKFTEEYSHGRRIDV